MNQKHLAAALLSSLPFAALAADATETTLQRGLLHLPLWILGFGAAVIAIELWLIRCMRAKWTPYSVIRLLGITLIIIASLVLVTGPSQGTQVSSVIGLLGTLAGYLLGKEGKERDVMPDANAEPDAARPAKADHPKKGG